MTGLTTQHGHRPNHGLVRMTDTQLPKALQLAHDLREAHAGHADEGPSTFSEAADELCRLHQHELAHIDWIEKTEWVQQTARPCELGLHRADVLKHRIERLEAELEQARAALAARGEPVARVELITAGGNAGIATRIVEIDVPSRERLRHGTKLYTAPPAPAKPMTDEEIDKLPWGPHEGNPITFAEGLRDFARAIEAHHGITAAPVTTLWCIHIPDPDELYAAPSKADAEHMAAKHNAAMATYYSSNEPNLEFAPSIESVQAVAIPWPHDTQSHADQMREFDWSGWGITDKVGA